MKKIRHIIFGIMQGCPFHFNYSPLTSNEHISRTRYQLLPLSLSISRSLARDCLLVTVAEVFHGISRILYLNCGGFCIRNSGSVRSSSCVEYRENVSG